MRSWGPKELPERQRGSKTRIWTRLEQKVCFIHWLEELNSLISLTGRKFGPQGLILQMGVWTNWTVGREKLYSGCGSGPPANCICLPWVAHLASTTAGVVVGGARHVCFDWLTENHLHHQSVLAAFPSYVQTSKDVSVSQAARIVQ